jgi:hypothetical protein
MINGGAIRLMQLQDTTARAPCVVELSFLLAAQAKLYPQFLLSSRPIAVPIRTLKNFSQRLSISNGLFALRDDAIAIDI